MEKRPGQRGPDTKPKRAPGGGRKAKSPEEKAVRAPDAWLLPKEVEAVKERFGNTTQALKAVLKTPDKDAGPDEWLRYLAEKFDGIFSEDGERVIITIRKNSTDNLS